MKRFIIHTILFLTICLSLSSMTSCKSGSSNGIFNSNTIRGNKNIVTKEIKISDYQSILLSGSYNITYEAKENAAPYLSLEIDENIAEYVEVSVEKNELNIRIKNGVSISTTRFNIKTNSKKLVSATLKGSGTLNIAGELKNDEKTEFYLQGSGDIIINDINTKFLDLQLRGSGDVLVKGKLKATNADVYLQGSGDVVISNLDAQILKTELRGSGDMTIKGKADSADYNLAGSGDMDSKGVEAKDVKCYLRGSGDMSVHSTQSLDANLQGSGDISYKGEPATLQKTIRGSGSIKSIK